MKIHLPLQNSWLRRALALTPIAASGCLLALPGTSMAQPERLANVRVFASLPAVQEFNKPAYPARALELGASGDVTVKFIVDENGQPRNIEVIEATAPQLFARSAMAAVKHSRYTPAVSDGRKVAVPVRITMHFNY